jgi:excisionase family DNA binding protein
MSSLVEPGNLLTIDQAAEALQQHPETVRLKVKAGTIPSVRLGNGPTARIRIPRDQLEAKLSVGLSSFRPAEPDARGRAGLLDATAQRGANGNSNTGRQ